MEVQNNEVKLYGAAKKIGFVTGLCCFILILLSPGPRNLEPVAWKTAAVACLMAVFWITEAVPIAVTALLPLIFFPLLGILDIKNTAAPYANPIIFLFMGGFIIAQGMQRWNLHKRMALSIIKIIGMKPKSIIAGFMIATAFLSMWVSNTATTLMMLPIGLSIIEIAGKSDDSLNHSKDFNNFAIVLLLSIAYSASIGGLGTLIGTPPNALLAAFMYENYHFQIGFAQWMLVGIPVVVTGIPLSYFILIRLAYPQKLSVISGSEEYIKSEIKKCGKITRAELFVAIIFGFVALLWMFRPLLTRVLPGLSDAGIAIFGAVLMFVIPVDLKKGEFILNWQYAEKLPWGVLLLFGGGLSLASAISSSGLSAWIGNELIGVSQWPLLLVVILVTTIVIFLTELTSNTATAATFLPIMAAVAVSISQNPLLFALPAAVAASCAFMLPVATPPNAIVYGSGRLTIPQMAKAGIYLNLLFILLITLFTFSIAIYVFHIRLGVTPDWVVR